MRVQRLYNAIIATTEMTDDDKAKLFDKLLTISEKQFFELEAIYVYGIFQGGIGTMSEYEKAMDELRKAYQTDDWDYILCCQIDVMLAKRKEGEQNGSNANV